MKSIQILSKAFALLFLSALVTFSCDNDDNLSSSQDFDPNATEFAENFGSAINRTFFGTVVDMNQNPIDNVMITIGNETAMTDSNGIFIIENAPVNQRFGYVKAEKAGYIHASRAVVPSDGTNKVRIMMLPETIAGTTSSGTQETIALANGSKVALNGDYIKPDGSTYSGNVNVIMHHLDPADENMPDQMPGMLYAENSQGQERMLQTFGMLAVELRGENGEDLNLAEGSTAEITVPLDISLVGNAPATIPLWYFDEANGYWIEEGEALLVGTSYVGTVSHFSFWNCDIPAEAINLCINVMNSGNENLSNLNIAITSATYGTRYGYTNENGQVCGLVPSNESLGIDIYSYDLCGESPIYSGTIGPFSSDSSIPITIDDTPDLISETVTGVFNDCNGDPVTNGYVDLRYGQQSFSELVTDGDFEINLIRCDAENTFRIKAYDYVNVQETDSLYYTFTTPLTNLGSIQSCNSIEEFISYQVEGSPTITYNFDIQGGIDGEYIGVSHYSINQNFSFNINIPDFNGLGTYTNGSINFFDTNNDGTTLESQFVGTTNVTAVGEVDEYIDINFSGVITDMNSPDELPISGTIHAKRDY
ncbi:hypothetical protein [Psychroserpens sp.]|uniref:hypothetical protein n=1 Tax=Psychroserpens sp. TaxID=2020870 RepID=UPI00385CB732